MALFSVTISGLKLFSKKLGFFAKRSKNLESKYDKLLQIFYAAEEKIFDSEGEPNKWQPITDEWAQRKARLGFGGLPIMQMTGALKNALTGKGNTTGKATLVIKKTKTALILSMVSPYWHNHQFGTTIPERQTVQVTLEELEQMNEIMRIHLFGG